jgi:RimJ/RimL family protein N-acetyltransferase
MHMEYFLKSRRLGFRCWKEEDLPLAMELWGDPEMTTFTGGPFTPEAVHARLADEILRMQEHGIQYWPVFLLEDDTHIGCAGLRTYDDEEQMYELGYYVRRAFWSKGLAKEAAKAVIDYAFGSLGFRALFAGHHPLNDASRRVLLGVGFSPAGWEVYPPTGILEPTYRLLKPGTVHNSSILRE